MRKRRKKSCQEWGFRSEEGEQETHNSKNRKRVRQEIGTDLVCLDKEIDYLGSLRPSEIPKNTGPKAQSASSLPKPSSVQSSTSPQAPAPTVIHSESDVCGQAASDLVAGSNLERTIQQILDMGGGSWDREMAIGALRAAFNNPERDVDYLFSGIPEQTGIPLVSRAPASGQAVNPPAQAQQPATTTPASGLNANPLDLFPHVYIYLHFHRSFSLEHCFLIFSFEINYLT